MARRRGRARGRRGGSSSGGRKSDEADGGRKKIKMEETEEDAGPVSPSAVVKVEPVEGDSADGGELKLFKLEEPEPFADVDVNSRLFRVEHPMLNPLLVKKVFSFYQPDLEDLKVLRLVCKSWFDVAYDMWRKKGILKLTESKESVLIQENERNVGEGVGLNIVEFLERFEDPEDPYDLAGSPYSKYSFHEMTIDMSICEEEGTKCKRFWDGVGPHIEHLHLNKCNFMVGQFMAFEQMFLEKLPNLNSLAITDTGRVILPTSLAPYEQRDQALQRKRDIKEKNFGEHGNLKTLRIHGGLPVKLKKLVARMPNLEDLTVRKSIYSSASYDESLMSLLIFMRRQRLATNNTRYNIKHLKLMHTKVFNSMYSVNRVFNGMQFPLESLSVEILPDQAQNRQPLKPMLQYHSGTLKLLKVYCPPMSNTQWWDEFPFDQHMEVLEEMHLFGNVVRDFKFLRWMPNLKRLLISRHCVDKWEELIMVKEGNNGLWFVGAPPCILPFGEDIVERTTGFEGLDGVAGNLKVLQIDYEFSPESLRRLQAWMPNVKSLWTILSARGLQQVVEGWGELRHLRALFGSDFDDEAICGEGGLVGLKDLRKFQYEALCGKSKLTDRAATEGILKLERLMSMQICVSAKFSVEVEAELKRRIPVAKVIRNYGKGPHVNDIYCCFHKEYSELLRKQENEWRERQEEERILERMNFSDSISASSSSGEEEDGDEGENGREVVVLRERGVRGGRGRGGRGGGVAGGGDEESQLRNARARRRRNNE